MIGLDWAGGVSFWVWGDDVLSCLVLPCLVLSRLSTSFERREQQRGIKRGKLKRGRSLYLHLHKSHESTGGKVAAAVESSLLASPRLASPVVLARSLRHLDRSPRSPLERYGGLFSPRRKRRGPADWLAECVSPPARLPVPSEGRNLQFTLLHRANPRVSANEQ